jgi:anhydromevalonate phosphate decarboxylase
MKTKKEVKNLREYIDFIKPEKLIIENSENERGKNLLSHRNPWLSDNGNFRIAAHLFSNKQNICDFFNTENLVKFISDSLNNLIPPEFVENNEFIEENNINLKKIPTFSLESLPLSSYLTSAIVLISTPNGINLSYHRAQVVDKNHLVLRIVKRHLFSVLEKTPDIQAVILFGCSPALSIAAASSFNSPGGEIELAGGLNNKPEHLCKKGDFIFPADCEMVLAGKFTGKMKSEGPFIDITGTYDPVRDQPLFEVEKIFRKNNPVIPMILPSGKEHGILMGLPREVSIFNAIKPYIKSLRDIKLTNGGSGWLHCNISGTFTESIKTIGEAALKAHPSMKRVCFLNEDIDPENAEMVEWAIATRCQPDKDIFLYPNEKGSSLDPSASDSITCKWVINTYINPEKLNKKYKKLL